MTTMDQSDVGFAKPPKHTQFKPGTSGNPKGRPKRKPAAALGEIANCVLNTSVEYREGDRRKKATRHELMLKGLVKQALRGSIAAAERLFKLRTHSQSRDLGAQRIELRNWLPEYPGQTSADRLRQHTTDADFDSLGERDPPNGNATSKKP
jgi:Family of unknown function (DUF5681)